MKKYLVLLVAGVLGMNPMTVKAQMQDQQNRDWYNCSFEEDGVYGAAVNKAYDFLKGKELKKRPVIAFIGTGMDVEHEDLQEAIWVNPSPTRGDVNGWNFIGGRDGEMLVTTISLADREYVRLKDKYAALTFNGGSFWKIEDGKILPVDTPVDQEEFDYYDALRQSGTSDVMQAHASLNMMYYTREFVARADRDLKAKYPGKVLTREDYYSLGKIEGYRKHRMDSASFYSLSMYFSFNKVENWEPVREYYLSDKHLKFVGDKYEKALAHMDSDLRKRVVGDDYMDLTDTEYGNDNLFSSACMAEVMRASIAVGKRGNGLGGDGIADFARLMSLCAYPEKGEPYGKDLILSLRYAVDHGADVVVLAYQLRTFTPVDRKGLLEALKYAESKDVLVIAPAWEMAEDVDKSDYCPNRFMGKEELTNLLVVGPSDRQGHPSVLSNYGVKGVDLFAPGDKIYAASPGDTYNMGTGTALSAGTVAGVAALVRGYYPGLSAGELRTLLMKTVTSRKGCEIEKVMTVQRRRVQDVFLFDELCVSGGIVNAYNAVVEAEKMGK